MPQNQTKLGVVDIILLVASMIASACIGFFFVNKNKSIDAYMFGDRQLSVVPVAISLMTSCMSGLTLLGASSEFYYQGPSYAFVVIPMLLCGPITAYTMLPIFYRMNELSLYKYLHKRYGLLIKYIISSIYILQMIFYNSVVLYLPSMALQALMGVSRIYSILIIGLMCVLYSAIGGLKAVVWTDLFQACLMYAAIIVVGVLGTYDAGGLGEVFKQSAINGRLQLTGLFSLDLTTRHTLLGIILGSTLKHVYLVGVNQVQIQRALSLPSLRAGQWSFMFCSLFAALIILLASFMGAIIVAAYQSCDPYLAGEIPRRDAIVVHYVANRLARIPGLRGLFVAGIFSATLSTLSSFSNSMAALALEDFIRPLMQRANWGQLTASATTRLVKLLAVLFGLLCVLMACVVDKANSRLLQATTTMFGAIGVPFLGSFALGIFTRYTNTWGVLAGLAVTLSLGIYVTIYQVFFTAPLEPTMPVFYDEHCARIFNMTMKPSDMRAVLELFEINPTSGNISLATSEMPFSIDRISYMTLPLVQFILMVVVASVFSLLTGGWHQEVNNNYLVPWVQSRRGKQTITPASSKAGYYNHYSNNASDTNNNNGKPADSETTTVCAAKLMAANIELALERDTAAANTAAAAAAKQKELNSLPGLVNKAFDDS